MGSIIGVANGVTKGNTRSLDYGSDVIIHGLYKDYNKNPLLHSALKRGKMSHSTNSLKGWLYIGDYVGDCCRAFKVDTRRLHYSSDYVPEVLSDADKREKYNRFGPALGG